METSRGSWLAAEKGREICRLRTSLLAAIDRLPLPPEEAAGILAGAVTTADLPKPPQEALASASEWILKGEGKEPPTPEIRTPEEQAVWGFALMAKTKGQKSPPQEVVEFVARSKRLEQELHMMGALLLGTVKNKDTRIGWGPPGSWFYHSPKEHRINMDPATAMILGLQNSRAICLHEVGHAAITKERSTRIKEIGERLNALKKQLPGGMATIKKEDMAEANRLAQELQMRETLWQYTEDAAVNTFAEIEGETFPTDIKEAALRCYASTLMSREISKNQTGNDPRLDALLKALAPKGPEAPPETTAGEEEKAKAAIEQRLKAAGAAYPISRGWMDNSNPKDWEEIGSALNKETQEIVDALAGQGGLASIQPAVTASRLAMLKGLSDRIAEECAKERNRISDEIFDKYIKPEMEKIPPTPEQEAPVWLEPSEGGGEEKDGKPEGKGKRPGEITLGESQEKETSEESKERAKRIRDEAAKQSMGTRSPLEALPEQCGSYEEFLEKCAEPISHAAKILKAIKNKQTQPGAQTPALLPERSLREFDLGAYTRAQEKMAGGENPTEEDFRFFKKTLKKEKPSQTRFGFYVDGSGSMFGEQTRKTIMTLLIFAEAARKIGGINVTAVYSGAGATELILRDTAPTEREKKVLGALMSSGHARGDNEICPGGLAELSTALRASTPKNTAIGATHYIFLTDGGSCRGQEKEIRKAIETLLDGNKNTTFDTVVVDGSEGAPFRQVSESVRTRRSSQMPQLAKAEKPAEIAVTACKLLTQRLRQIKSFTPLAAATVDRTAKKTEKTLGRQEASIA